ncbi:MAG: tetraacyldisaccharide 4'-kinase, partial [Nitrospinae bacterium RIFCSPLOWO2_12_FULL_47_7]
MRSQADRFQFKEYTPFYLFPGINFMNHEDLYYRIISRNRKYYHIPLFLCLRLIAFFYGWVQIIRLWCYRLGIFPTRKLGCRVISIGNLTLGGTGKTPMTLWIAETLRDNGYKPAIISRGYGGLVTDGVHVVSDGQQILLSPEVAGDESFMMAERLKNIPVLTSRDRYTAGLYAIDRFDVDTVILDDGFQHLALHRDLNILLCDQKEPLGNGLLFPAGHLREPVQAFDRADVICLTRCSGDSSLDVHSLRILQGRKGNRKGRKNFGKKTVIRTVSRLDCLVQLLNGEADDH